MNSPETVYERIKAKHLVFSESREEREIRIDSEHASLAKGKLIPGTSSNRCLSIQWRSSSRSALARLLENFS